ncbi:hypothetical protein Halru_1291 [Halovivax ruber XH-70]|uniref:Type I restriction enzyme R protein N-terminal domain-containing protein n=1 Tax=Halovivax ruber (strain DSM 18193 / JCM 13892 / XH-70) TaxID=797302 RepID=L0I8J6_HALRX|nr:hypothetical protein [Halovivax ruber]AGB15905.1 hypothetical protein Halru_1291 [Halovivax ruber XH-70]
MSEFALDRYASRLDRVLSVAPPRSRRETISWVLQPLWTHLGWDVDAAIGRGTIGQFEYDSILVVGSSPSTPAILVAAEPADQSLSPDRRDRIAAAMRQSGIDRAIYSNGRQFVLFAGDGSDRVEIEHESIPTRSGQFAPLSHDAVTTHCRDLPTESVRRRRIAVSGAEIASSIESILTEELGSSPPVDEASIPALLAAIDESATADGSGTDSSGQAIAPSQPSDSDPGAEPDGPAPERPESIAPASDETGEFVVRVFNDRGSIGAVAHSTSAGALVEAAAYFFERGLSGIRLPWSPDGGSTVVHDEPVDSDGTTWDAYEQLPNGLYVKTSGSVADRRRRVEALASRAGLRVMLRGDWSN